MYYEIGFWDIGLEIEINYGLQNEKTYLGPCAVGRNRRSACISAQTYQGFDMHAATTTEQLAKSPKHL